eukprot:GHVU01034487.1.p1 GENE.GHVU01034487.1~~GHVU01034487.1.p1  ORF type:complete len:234 (-),score=35.50 GHVU01034487.1:704-1405(-)
MASDAAPTGLRVVSVGTRPGTAAPPPLPRVEQPFDASQTAMLESVSRVVTETVQQMQASMEERMHETQASLQTHQQESMRQMEASMQESIRESKRRMKLPLKQRSEDSARQMQADLHERMQDSRRRIQVELEQRMEESRRQMEVSLQEYIKESRRTIEDRVRQCVVDAQEQQPGTALESLEQAAASAVAAGTPINSFVCAHLSTAMPSVCRRIILLALLVYFFNQCCRPRRKS